MCGIICLLQYGSGGIEIEKALECLNKLKDRGPDKQSFVNHKMDNCEVFMGFARLAIMDTSDAGLQPFHDEKDNSVICNGEIYNYKELAKSHNIQMKTDCDCEILLPLYDKVGFRNMILTELDAEFATVILSKYESKIYAARDRYGVRPLFYGYNKTTKTIGFASELGALHSVMEFVEQVKPNMMFSIDLNKNSDDVSLLIEKTSYYSYDSLIANIHLNNGKYIQEQIRYYLTEAVKKRLYADRPIGFLLSGGLDSSLIVAIATRILGPDNIVCFSIGIEGSPDVEAAKKVVEFLGIKQHHIIPFSVEQGLDVLPQVIKILGSYDITTIRASTPQYIMAQYISKNTNIKVLLSGEGSDEIHGSYRYFRDAPDVFRFHAETIRLLEELYLFDNKRTDRTMAGNGLEVRVPFLDFEYVEFITRINPYLLMYSTDFMEKQIVRDSFKGYLPNEILYRSKEAFSDAVSNSDTNWAATIQMIANKEISDSDLVDNEFVINRPRTKDALYFRRIFNNIYPGRDNVLPHYWLPRFQKEEVLDPSARVLKCY
ncbi:glutamine-dependent asparagine synthetase [Tupanvirus deep ocean]|uniref:Glutamine-dependent asparagine synthetase n=2 Tax=Tupanvirus TaxID=2094720 RepID=A0AC62A972_9VIRU|nr:glutamine-dependent asparagine synthetase [Tupanvirus deep ocean]QKU34178.1 glutamine-dependent asparagine synthetase [Tupanvirus deep ocean]